MHEVRQKLCINEEGRILAGTDIMHVKCECYVAEDCAKKPNCSKLCSLISSYLKFMRKVRQLLFSGSGDIGRFRFRICRRKTDLVATSDDVSKALSNMFVMPPSRFKSDPVEQDMTD